MLHTLQDLLNALNQLTPEQLKNDITYYDSELEEYIRCQYNLEIHDENNPLVGDILDHGHPYFEITMG